MHFIELSSSVVGMFNGLQQVQNYHRQTSSVGQLTEKGHVRKPRDVNILEPITREECRRAPNEIFVRTLQDVQPRREKCAANGAHIR